MNLSIAFHGENITVLRQLILLLQRFPHVPDLYGNRYNNTMYTGIAIMDTSTVSDVVTAAYSVSAS